MFYSCKYLLYLRESFPPTYFRTFRPTYRGNQPSSHLLSSEFSDLPTSETHLASTIPTCQGRNVPTCLGQKSILYVILRSDQLHLPHNSNPPNFLPENKTLSLHETLSCTLHIKALHVAFGSVLSVLLVTVCSYLLCETQSLPPSGHLLGV